MGCRFARAGRAALVFWEAVMEYKTTAAFTTKLDDGQGIVETIFAVMGNIDKGKDRIWPGAFTEF